MHCHFSNKFYLLCIGAIDLDKSLECVDNNDPVLSIIIPVYNHEKYIVKALDSVLMQKTKYSYEVLIGEDCSTDNTRSILKEYEKKHPGIFTIYYRDHNMNCEKIQNYVDLMIRSRGKYLIVLEGDDFWTDENKIETQLDFLESHDDYIAVAHRCAVVDKNGIKLKEKYPECRRRMYSLKQFAYDFLPGQTATILSRNYYKYSLFDMTLINNTLPPGDRRLAFSLACAGKIYCIPKIMSAYRHVVTEGSSYSATHKFDYNSAKELCMAIIDYAKRIDNNEAVLCAEAYYVHNLRSAIRSKQITLGEAENEFKNLTHRYRATVLMLKGYCLHYIRVFRSIFILKEKL